MRGVPTRPRAHRVGPAVVKRSQRRRLGFLRDANLAVGTLLCLECLPHGLWALGALPAIGSGVVLALACRFERQAGQPVKAPPAHSPGIRAVLATAVRTASATTAHPFDAGSFRGSMYATRTRVRHANNVRAHITLRDHPEMSNMHADHGSDLRLCRPFVSETNDFRS